PLYAQDEDLSALELAIQEDNYKPTKNTPSRLNQNKGGVETLGRNIDLRSVLEEGFRKNPFEQIRTQQKEQIELSKTDVWQKFWLPTVSLEMETSNHRIDRFKEAAQNTPTMGAQQAPTGSLGLVLGEYTLFNWGRDYLEYQNEKQTLGRQSQRLNESRRRLRFALISQYFNLVK